MYCCLRCVYTGRNGDPDNEVDPEVVTVPPVYGKGEPVLELNIFETTEFR